jgi:hypothetical protein
MAKSIINGDEIIINQISIINNGNEIIEINGNNEIMSIIIMK